MFISAVLTKHVSDGGSKLKIDFNTATVIKPVFVHYAKYENNALQYCSVHLKFVKRIDLKCSQHTCMCIHTHTHTHTHTDACTQEPSEILDVSINLTVAVISQCTCSPGYHVAHESCSFPWLILTYVLCLYLPLFI